MGRGMARMATDEVDFDHEAENTRTISKNLTGKSNLDPTNHYGLELYRIEVTTGVEVSAGLHWYLKYWCGADISVGQDRTYSWVMSPTVGPITGGQWRVTVKQPVPWNYYQNVVTSSCSLYVLIEWLGLI